MCRRCKIFVTRVVIFIEIGNDYISRGGFGSRPTCLLSELSEVSPLWEPRPFFQWHIHRYPKPLADSPGDMTMPCSVLCDENITGIEAFNRPICDFDLGDTFQVHDILDT